MTELYIGLISGTSMDAVDAVLVDFSDNKFNLIATHNEPIPSLLKSELGQLCQPGFDEINRLGQLDIQVALLFANAATQLIQSAGINHKQVRAIGSHGQTIRHQPKYTYPFTLQIGDPNTIAEITRITTIADFRRRDIACGGQGAPLVPAFHQQIFADSTRNRVILNIGGIANITLLPANKNATIIGFDTGPGNTLLDQWMQLHHQRDCDHNGEWASRGKINQSLLTNLLADSYFSLPSPKSTGREYFNLNWLKNKSMGEINATDVQTTLAELTAQSIMQAINQYAAPACEILVCGGGVHNNYLMQRLQQLAGTHSITSTAKFGVDPNWVEAITFAWLAKQTLTVKPGNLPSVTGAKQPTVLGGIYHAYQHSTQQHDHTN